MKALQIQAFGQPTDVAKWVDIRNPRGVWPWLLIACARRSHGQQDNQYKNFILALFPSLALLSTDLSCAKAHSSRSGNMRESRYQPRSARGVW
jgi:hypothetical protein